MADVYVNGTQVGAVDGFIGPCEFDATQAVKPGAENVLACRVDSTGPAPVGMFNFVGRWGGLYRECGGIPTILFPAARRPSRPTSTLRRSSISRTRWLACGARTRPPSPVNSLGSEKTSNAN
jgi:hypothetical protein